MSTTGKVVTWTSVIAVLALAVFIFFKFCFVYSEGVNEGDINYFQKEGFLFKTYEGKMIQTGLKNTKVQGSIQSNEFKFSVVDEHVAKQLNDGANAISDALDKLDETLEAAQGIDDPLAKARSYRDGVLAAMGELREACDAMEGIVSTEAWPMPTYNKILFYC